VALQANKPIWVFETVSDDFLRLPTANYRTNNWGRPENTGVNTDDEQIANFEAGCERPEIAETIPEGISWRGHEICSSGSPVFAPDIGPIPRYSPVIGGRDAIRRAFDTTGRRA